MQLVNDIAEAYALQHTTGESGALRQVGDFTAAHAYAHMGSGTVQGMLLQLFSCMLRPRYILEVGTFTGYSALCLSKGLQPGGMLHTIELRPEDAAQAVRHVEAAGMAHCIRQHTGPAADIIPQLTETWDLAFIDADKTGYIDYYELILPRLRSGGFIVADNVLFHGQVLATPVTGKNATAIHAFNAHVAADERVEQVLLTVRDGLLVIRKK